MSFLDGKPISRSGQRHPPATALLSTARSSKVTIGLLSFVGSLISGLAQPNGLGPVMITLPLAGQGLTTTAIGIPLWISGAERVLPEELVAQDETQPTWTPEVNIGAGNLTMTSRF